MTIEPADSGNDSADESRSADLRSLREDFDALAERVRRGLADRDDLDDLIGRLRAFTVREFGPRKAARRGEAARPRSSII